MICDFKSLSSFNIRHISDSDIVFYILGTDDELKFHPNNLPIIGSNHFHYELFKLWQHTNLYLLRFFPQNSSKKEQERQQQQQQIIQMSRPSSPVDVGEGIGLTSESVRLRGSNYIELPKQIIEFFGLLKPDLLSKRSLESETRTQVNLDEDKIGDCGCSCGAFVNNKVKKQDISSLEKTIKDLIENKRRPLVFKCTKYAAQPTMNSNLSNHHTPQILEFVH